MKIDILGVKYTVHSVGRGRKELLGKRGEQYDGRVVHGTREIYINRDDQSEPEKITTLLHEVIHTISNRTGAKLKESDINALTTGIQYVLSKNKSFAKSLSRRKQ